jgi:cytochrome c oxidase subunit 1
MLGALSVNIHVTDTYFVVGHFHYVMFGGTGFALFGALHYWFPKMFGRMYNKRPAFIGWLFMTVGFNILYFPMLILGYMGMPRRYYHYLSEYETLQRIATVGSWIMVIGILLLIINLLEWTVSSPPPTENFHKIPVVTTGPYDYSEYERTASEAT